MTDDKAEENFSEPKIKPGRFTFSLQHLFVLTTVVGLLLMFWSFGVLLYVLAFAFCVGTPI